MHAPTVDSRKTRLPRPLLADFIRQRSVLHAPLPAYSNLIAHRIAREAAIDVEHPVAPAGDRIVRFQEPEWTCRARPLESAEHGVISIGWTRTTEERL